VDIAESPASGKNMGQFSPDFPGYDVVILNYQGDSWPEQTRIKFVNYVNNGGGVFVYHSANHAFPDWKEYNTIIGLGGSKGRNETQGPYVFFKDEKIVMDASPGIAAYHGHLHEFVVTNRETNHPITKGIPVKWMHARDELYSLLRGPAKNLTVLATAYSDPVYSGSGRHEPVLFTILYGKGRVFHTVLGHTGKEKSSNAVECAGFIVTFQRGTEWAATGKVTQIIPGDFPAVHTDVPFLTQVRIWPDYRPPSLKHILDELRDYEEGTNDQIILQLQRYIFANRNSPDSRTACEKELITFLESNVTATAKMAVCRHLQTVGSQLAVPVLKELLLKEDTSDAARYALEKIPGDAAHKAFIDSLKETQIAVKFGIISSLGNRKDISALPVLKKYLYGSDKILAESAAAAIGQISSIESAEILSQSLKDLKGDLRIKAAFSLLLCTDQLLEKKAQIEPLYKFYQVLMTDSIPLPIQQAAVKGKILTTHTYPIQMVMDLLKEKDFFLPAINMIPVIFSEQHLPYLCPLLTELPAVQQVQLLAVFSKYKIPETRRSAVTSLKSTDSAVRIAALEALAKIGSANTLGLLAEHAARSTGIEQTTARKSLWTLQGQDIDQAILTGLVKTADPKIRTEYLRSISERCILSGISLVMDQIRTDDPRNRLQAIRTCRKIAPPSSLPELLKHFLSIRSEAEANELGITIASVSSKITILERRGDAVTAVLEETEDPKSRARLIRILGKIGDNSKLALLRLSLNDENKDIKDAAVRALADWPGLSPKYDLLQITRNTGDSTHKILALRAYIRMIERDKYQSPEGAVQSLKTALGLASRPEEKKLVLGVLPVFACKEALILAESLLEDETVQDEARAAIEQIQKNIRSQS
jgi:HEAT repeat protein